MSDEPRAYTADEVRADFLDHIRNLVVYWDTVSCDRTRRERLEGLAFSILSLIDGSTEIPSFDLVVRPHPEDKAYHIEEGSNWYEDGTVINESAMLHEEFYQKKGVGK